MVITQSPIIQLFVQCILKLIRDSRKLSIYTYCMKQGLFKKKTWKLNTKNVFQGIFLNIFALYLNHKLSRNQCLYALILCTTSWFIALSKDHATAQKHREDKQQTLDISNYDSYIAKKFSLWSKHREVVRFWETALYHNLFWLVMLGY